MRLFRYRNPSLKTMLGITKAKKRFNNAVGITAVKRPFRAWGNFKRRMLRHIRANEIFPISQKEIKGNTP